MKSLSLEGKSDRVAARYGLLSKWIYLPICFFVVVHATILFTLQTAQCFHLPLGILIGSGSVLFMAHIFLVATHETGHYIGAWIGGMCVYKANIGPVEFLRDVAGWRMRIAWPKRLTMHAIVAMLGGTVYACPDPSRASRRQYLWMLAGGPASNFFCAAALFLIAQAVQDEGSAQLIQAFAYLNFAMGLANLVPCAMPQESDGKQLLKWLAGRDNNEPGLILSRLVGMSMHGLPEPELLYNEIQKLQTMPAPMPLIHLFFFMKDLQFRASWDAVSDLTQTLDEHVLKTGATQSADLADLIAMFR